MNDLTAWLIIAVFLAAGLAYLYRVYALGDCTRDHDHRNGGCRTW